MIQEPHYKNFHDLANVSVFIIKITTDEYKIVNDTCPPIMKRIFNFRGNIRNL